MLCSEPNTLAKYMHLQKAPRYVGSVNEYASGIHTMPHTYT